MRKLFYICVLSLLASIAAAQSTATHQLKVTWQPLGSIYMQAYYTDSNGNYQQYNSEALDAFDMQLSAGQIVSFSGNGKGFVLKQVTANGQATDFETPESSYGTYYFTYTMPDADVELVFTFEYDPDAPDFQPGDSGWYPETGTLVWDHRTYSYPANFNMEEDAAKVLRLILGGPWVYSCSSDDARLFPHCHLLDYSRTAATQCSPWEDWSETAVTEVILPSTMQELGERSFAGAHLQSLTCFAMTPPKMSGTTEYDDNWNIVYKQQNAFTDCPGMVVYVPEDALPLYQNTNGWKEFTIQPIEGNSVSLNVNLMAAPTDAALALYKNMHLELTSLGTGQVRRLLVGPRNAYTFRYLPTNTSYRLVLRSASGAEMGRIDAVTLGETDGSVTFTQLKAPRTVTLSVIADGEQVDNTLYTASWLNADGLFIKQANQLEGMIEGQQLRLFVALDRELGMKYEQPDTIAYTVGANDANNDVKLTLSPLTTTIITFNVVDSLTSRGISGATIQVSQLLGSSQMGNSHILTTAFDGTATAEVTKSMSMITVSTTAYGAQSFTANLADSTDFRVLFSPANGTTIRVDYTYEAAIEKGKEPRVEQGYGDARSLHHEFTNLSTGQPITQFLDNNPFYTLFSTLPEGTRVRVTATSTDGKVEAAEAEGIVDETGTVKVTLPIVERGYIHVSYQESESNKPAAMVFNAKTGQLVKKQAFGNYLSLDFKELALGDYFVVAMSQGEQYQGISNVSHLQSYTEGKDYVMERVSITNGNIVHAAFSMIPLIQTPQKTLLKENRAFFKNACVNVGEYATISVAASFIDELAIRPTNVRLVVNLPEDVNLVHNSVLKEKETAKYSYEGSQMTMPWDELADAAGNVLFCVMPIKAGTLQPEAYIAYTLNGEEHQDPLLATTLTVLAQSISVPELVLTPSFTIKGTAPKNYFPDPPQEVALGASHNARAGGPDKAIYNWHDPNFDYYPITIMDGNEEIGKINPYGHIGGGVYTSYSWVQGNWEGTCTLPNPYVRSKHKIWAKMKGRNGTLETAAHEVTYDPDAVIPLTTKMSFFNYHPVHLENVDVIFDYQENMAYPSSYGFSNEEGYNTDFTFEVDLSNNDTTKVYAVALHIYTEGPDAEERISMAHYNARKNRWLAYEKFNLRSLPSCVYVEPFYHEDIVGERRAIDDCFKSYDEACNGNDEQRNNLIKKADQLAQQLKQAIDKGEMIATDELETVLEQIESMLGIETGQNITNPKDLDELKSEAEILKQQFPDIEQMYDYLSKPMNELGMIVDGYTITTADGMTAEKMLAEGYVAVRLDDGSSVYSLSHADGSCVYVDIKKNLKIIITAEAAAVLSRKGFAPKNEEENNIEKNIWKIKGLLDDISAYCSIIDKSLEETYMAYDLINNHLRTIINDPNSSWIDAGLALLERKANIQIMSGLHHARNIIKKFTVGPLFDAVNFVLDMKTYASGIQRADRLASDIYSFRNKNSCYSSELASLHAAASYLYEDTYVKTTGLLMTTFTGLSFAVKSAMTSAYLTAISAPATTTAFITSVGGTLASLYGAKVIMDDFNNEYNYLCNQFHLLQLACDKLKECKERGDCPKCVDTGDCPHWPLEKSWALSSIPQTTPLQDPSGFVYEGVESNRVQGATTTVFYKNQTTNMYGDPVDVVTVWDAENYGQQNPQLTDENGEYGWMVPEGWWQVKYEKEGYQTELSEWLPVPPPQLDVNQQLVQYSQPIVSGVKATQQGVQVQFDKYMRPATLTTENIHVTRQGNELPGTIELLNAEQHDGVELASKVRFVPSEPLPVGQTLVLTVGGDVQSYAKVAMGDAFTQEFDIVQAVEKIVADSAVNVIYDQTTELTISALPAQAAAGHKVKVRLLSDVVASISADELTLDADGKAALRITGEAHGTTGIILQMANDEDVQTLVMVNVKDESDFICPLPTANYISGTQLYYGTAVELSSELPGATIYYTLDGSCPCEQDMKYTQPIIVTADTYIKAIAVADGYTDSDIRELRYTVRRDATRLHLPVGWTWLSHAQRDEVTLSQLGEGVDYVAGESGDPVSTLLPATAYKVHTSTSHDVLLQGFAWDAATGIIQLQKGWNWMPYPMPVALTPTEALAYALPQDGEVLVGEDGFAIYERGWDDAAWTGTLQKMEPGHAYMYLSASERPIFLNTTVVKSQADNVQPPTMFRWYDRHAQPNRMPVVAQLYDAQGTLIASDLARYEVTAWSADDQCRGNGYWMERHDCLFLNVMGQGGEQVEFRVHDTQTDKTYALSVVDRSALTFTTDMHGTLAQPLMLQMGGELSGIIEVQRSATGDTTVYDLQGRKVTLPQRPSGGMQRGVYIDRGKKVVVK